MKTHSIAVSTLAILICLSSKPLTGQQPVVNLSQAVLAQSLATLVQGNIQIHDIALRGDVEHIAGALDEKGSATLIALADGSTRVDFDVPSKRFQETVRLNNSALEGDFSGSNGKIYPRAPHNLLVDSAWFCPAMLAIRASFYATKGEVETLRGQDDASSSIIRLRSYRRANSKSEVTNKEVRRLSQIDIDIDKKSFEVVGIRYQIHSDSNSLVSVPIQVVFSNYQFYEGVKIPTQIRRSENGVLVWDIHITSAEINHGQLDSKFHL